MQLVTRQGGVRTLFSVSFADQQIGLAWLGQAGFAVRYGDRHLLIDPYLSDHLAEKYRGTEFPHVRMMPSPIEPDDVHGLDLVLCSHGHSDHMDPGTLPALARNNPHCRFVVPQAEIGKARQRGLPDERMIAVNADETVRLFNDIELAVTPAAHEQFNINERGEHHFLGFVLRLGETVVYHAGDTVPYEGLEDQLARHGVDVALLPINGRDEYRASHGVPGNLTFDEAVDLCLKARIGLIIPCHFGMFEFNTTDVNEVARKIDQLPTSLQCILPRLETWYGLEHHLC